MKATNICEYFQAEVAKPVVEKKAPPPEVKKEVRTSGWLFPPKIVGITLSSFIIVVLQVVAEAPPPVEEKKRRPTGRTRAYRGNMNLIQRVNKDAARQAMRGIKRTSAPNGNRKHKRAHKGSRSAWELFTRRLFGTLAQETVVLRDEKTKAAAEALGSK